VVDDGNTIVLEGLIQNTLTVTTQQIPLLGDIPFLGALFRFKSEDRKRTNLMIFLRPVIIRSADDGLSRDAGPLRISARLHARRGSGARRHLRPSRARATRSSGGPPPRAPGQDSPAAPAKPPDAESSPAPARP